MKTINVELSEAGIQQALREIDQWKTEFDHKMAKFAKRLAEEGKNIVNIKLGSVDSSHSPGSVKVTVDESATGGDLKYKANYYMGGGQAIFIEFGAGVWYNTGIGASAHPKGVELGYEIGSWSFGPNGHGFAAQSGWFYNGEFTHGTPTYMPMYSSVQELAQKVQQIAREVFGNG